MLLLALGILYVFEDRREARLVLPGLRPKLDRGVLWLQTSVRSLFSSVRRNIAGFILRYGVYRALGSIVGYLVQLEQRVERAILHQKHTDAARRTPNHLDEIAAHKEATALSDKERQRRRE